MLGYLNLCLEQTHLKGSVVYVFIFKQIGSMALFSNDSSWPHCQRTQQMAPEKC